ncbi:MAG: ribose-5-phosphate isomerase [Candidatus Taylorbacteria bacterium RIFCSPLOWO2_01_FULL_44_26]|uniref:Ribose-5-phosphate isomerase n=2 Tax=Candidatus Tayloriibacteriota TaxID=1817919 RepID=A0A1G2MJI7_9BACT|nr:MAG: ribose-5-phosphate isomerase [Candidatus Taylorbacteria bacterium RIFCSPHIGHO2_02_FULL_44_12]OHA31284.1 MAG: ribose-5-phosphate isomerase [Candidatus Taylorbacteria bacterium RIFCSPLOWO2_01_FULL_44_26]
MIIILASDHAGFALKEEVKLFIQEKGYDVLDVGTETFVEDDDYPMYMKSAAIKVSEDLGGNTKAIVFGGSGQGEAIVCNRFKRVRAIVWYGGDMEIIRKSREHNDANILSIGARFVGDQETKKVVELWLNTPFSKEERHVRRIAEIDEDFTNLR